MKRRLLIVAALGAVLNLAVAWTCALTMDLGHGQVSELFADVGPDHHWEVYRWDTIAGTRIMSRCWKGFAAGPYNHGDPADHLSAWGEIRTPTAPMPPARSEIDEGWGLPMRSMGCYFVVQWTTDGESDSHHTGVLSFRKSSGVGDPALYLPMTPLWLGSVLNTIVYALVIVAVHGAVRDLRLYCARCRTRSSPTKAMTST